jgi:hypothetical protein
MGYVSSPLEVSSLQLLFSCNLCCKRADASPLENPAHRRDLRGIVPSPRVFPGFGSPVSEVLNRLILIFRLHKIWRWQKILAYKEEPGQGNHENNGSAPSEHVDSFYFREPQEHCGG